MKHTEFVLVLDFGSQYTQLIARRVRELGVYSEIHPFNYSIEKILSARPSGIILSGGPSSVYEGTAPHVQKGLFELGIPVLGICYGLQLMTHLSGGRVDSSSRREFGRAELEILDQSDLFRGIPQNSVVWMSHGDAVTSLAPGFDVIAKSRNAPLCAVRDPSKKLYGVQFHPEVVHTADGKKILSNFVHSICGCSGGWTPSAFIEESVREIKRRVGSEKVLCALSGGVDSSVLAVLLHKAVGDNLQCIHINNGVMRKGESESVVDTFRRRFRMNLDYVDASHTFLSRLKGIDDPEKKRKIIGKVFIEVFEKEAKKFGSLRFKFLAQGTLYPDVIESVSFKGPSATIKSHHNVGGLPEQLNFELLEPFRELFKDEVREVGKLLGLPDELLGRHPFPGPGLAVRIPGEVTEDAIRILQEADSIFTEEIRAAGLYRDVWQAFAVLLPVKSVGVMGDVRTYERVVSLRAVTSIDGMTADWARLPYDVLARVSNRIINEVRGVNRVLFDISSKPPATIEWE